jgi:hypothetical protein
MILDLRAINSTKEHGFKLKDGEGYRPATRGIDGTGFVSVVCDIQSFLQTGNEGVIMWSVGRKGVTLQFSGLSPTKNLVVRVKWGFNLVTKLCKVHHVNNIVNTSGKSLLLVKLVTIAGCVRVRVLLLIYRIHRNEVIKVLGARTSEAAVSIIIK